MIEGLGPVPVHLCDGRIVDLRYLKTSDVRLDHIVHTLSQMPRYGARTGSPGAAMRGAYSVLQHSLFLVQLVPTRFRRQALTHDFPEAYLPDIPFSIKALLPHYQALENSVWDVLLAHDELDLEPIEEPVWKIDVEIRELEIRYCFPNQPVTGRPHQYLEYILSLPAADVRTVFYDKWNELNAARR